MRKLWIIILVIAVIGGLGYFGYRRATQAKAAAKPDYETVTVGLGNIAATVSATGEVLPEREADLAFQGAGPISDIAVEVGDTVTAGQLLAQLDTTDLQLAVRQAEIGVRTAQAQLRQLNEGPNSSDVAAAKAALVSAQAAYQQLLEGSDADQMAAARASVEQARVAMEQAQQSYDRIKDMPNAGMLPQALQLQQATISYETAQAQYRVAARAANQAQRAAAQAQIAQAQASLDRLLKGPSAAQVEVTQAGVDQAEVALAQAQRRMDNAQLKAPWDGTVAAIRIVEGTQAQPGVPAIKLADTGRLHIDVQVDEVDIAGVAEGQPVTVEVDALPDQRLIGKVQRISPTASVSPTGASTYQVRIEVNPADLTTPAVSSPTGKEEGQAQGTAGSALLRTGMSATATIVSDERRDVLVVPNRAVRRDSATGQTFVERLAGDAPQSPQSVEVRLGLSDDQQSEVRAGLNQGDQLVIRTRSSLEQLQQTFGGF